MTTFLIVLVISIAILIFLIAKLNVHPVIGLFAVSLLAGIGLGYTPVEAANMIASGFGGTLTSIGITIIFGCIIAESMRDTNAMRSLINSFIKLLKGKCLELSTALSAFIVSIPVFGDVSGVFLFPTASALAKRTKQSLSRFGAFNGLAAALTHAVVPPTPGILAVALLCGANLGLVIGYGVVLCFIAFIVTWALLRNWVGKTWIEPRADLTIGIEPVESNDYHDLLLQDKFLPPVFIGIFPVLVPVILIAGSSILALNLPEGNALREFFVIIGDRNIAMTLGVISALVISFVYKDHVLENYNKYHNTNETNVINIILNKWVMNALEIALVPLMITAMGGAFSNIIKSYSGVEEMGNLIASFNVPSFVVPFIIASILMVAVGSQTTASMTAVAICVPMMSQLNLSPEAMTLLIGAGTMVGNHLNNSGFWGPIMYYNFTVKDTLKFSTLSWALAGILLLIQLGVLCLIGLI